MKMNELLGKLRDEGYILVARRNVASDARGWTAVLADHWDELVERGEMDADYTVWYSRESDDPPFGDGSRAYIAAAGRHGEPLYDRVVVELVQPSILVTRRRDADGDYRVRVITNIARGSEFLALDFRAGSDEIYDLRGTWVTETPKVGDWVRYADHPRSARSDEWAMLGGLSGLAEKIRSCHGFPRYDRIASHFGRERFPSIPAVLKVELA